MPLSMLSKTRGSLAVQWYSVLRGFSRTMAKLLIRGCVGHATKDGETTLQLQVDQRGDLAGELYVSIEADAKGDAACLMRL